MKLLMTGVSGMLGSYLAEEIGNEHEIFTLVRGGKKRVMNNKFYGVKKENIIDGDITKDLVGLSKIDFKFLRNAGIEKIIHSAASVKFDEKYKEETWATNYIGTKNIITLAKRIDAKEIHYISTAYSESRRNPYEHSKSAAESLIKESGLSYMIHAPAIIVGNSKNGDTRSYTGFYGYLKGMNMVATQAKKFLKTDKVYLPIYIDCSFTSTLNLVPIDWIVGILKKLICKKAKNLKLYLVHPCSRTFHDLCLLTFKALKVEGVKYNDYRQRQPLQNHAGLKILQEKMNQKAKIFLPYVTQERNFPILPLKDFLGKEFIELPVISDEFINLLIKTAIARNFKIVGPENKEKKNEKEARG